MWKNPRPAYPNELYHHGVKGMSWGVRNGPPYPIGSGKTTINYTRNRDAVNSIFNTMNDKEKINLAGTAGSAKVPKQYVSKREYGKNSNLVDTHVVYNGKMPVAFCDIWNFKDGRALIAIGTRGGDSFRHKGYASIALQEGIKSFKLNPNLNELDYYIHSGNNASLMLAKKHGFKEFENNEYFTGLKLTKTPRHKGR